MPVVFAGESWPFLPPEAACRIVSNDAVVEEAAAYAVIQRRRTIRIADCLADVLEIAVDHTVEVTIELETTRTS